MVEERKTENKQAFTFNGGYLIFILTALAFCNSYFFELGFCEFYNIPKEYISIEISKQALPLFIVIGFFFVISLTFDGYFSHLKLFSATKNRLVKILIVAIFAGLPIYFFGKDILVLATNEAVILIICFVFGLSLILNQKRKNDSYEILDPKISIVINISRKFGSSIGLILILLSISCLISFISGYRDARGGNHFFKKKNSDFVLLKRYQSINIFGQIIDNKIETKNILIEENISKTDTLIAISLKD
jgi:hypothetical protein